MKRHTETNKWKDRWFRLLTRDHKLLYLYLLDVCDAAGVVEFDEFEASFDTQTQPNLRELVEKAGPERILELPNGRFWLVK